MTAWFSADLHLGHAKILQYANRPHATVEEMNEAIIDNWNGAVRKKDEAYILGDFCFGNPNKFYDRLNGAVYLIPGSHDKQLKQLHKATSPVLPALTERKFVYDGQTILIVMCHYAMRKWNRCHYGTYHIYGHSHGNLPPFGLSFDVGVDTNNFFPYSLDDVVAKMKTLSREFVLETYR
jgi:calcineurin-like phosphoesterase family protein